MAGTLAVPNTGTVTGLTMANDMNIALAALASCNAGASAPTTGSTGLSSLADIWWYDTTNKLLKRRDHADTVWMVVAAVDETNKLFTPSVAPMLGSARNLLYTSAGGVNTATLTYAELLIKTGIGGAAVLALNGSITVNLGGTGVDGLDTGTIAANQLYRTYAIYNISTGAIHTLTTKDSNANPSPIPAGYVAMSVVGYLLTDATPHILAFTQQDRHFAYQTPVNVFTGSNLTTTLTTQSVSVGVPVGAKTADFIFGSTANVSNPQVVAADATGTGAVWQNIQASSGVLFFGFQSAASFAAVPLATAQIIFIAGAAVLTGNCRLSISGFAF